MLSKSKLAIVAALLAASIATPALARESHYGAATRYSGRQAFAMVPRGALAGNSIYPGATGGGSVGYNWALEHDE
jgi:hypothetical protein